ncbi:Grx4 family monothiol glutaredoxin [Vulgatibacter incomptus]|uniref:Glutaredoxin n=1 Tax=Vulgatibacter incomptus TaxID=1391653 RepID=A0A0K1PJK6_9BACT|nr:Grx4 family monothiol glutaredoxin [Vulgatibacter incomptus]AKU93284.1 putative monothiol glutaredoxin ycf64-like [Vulgatibacter incomptus]
MNEELKKRIDELVKGHKVVLFMKGSPMMPMCGFSASAVETLRKAGATDVGAVDVLKDPEIRQGIKEYSSWPTIPQIFIDGEFVGGCDILGDLHERGELAAILAKKD